MKITYIVAGLFIVGVTSGVLNTNAFAQPNDANHSTSQATQSVNAQYNTILTKVDAQGYIFNSNDICIGTIDKSGVIRNGNNANLGRIYNNGYVYDAKNNAVGRMDKKGNFYTQYSVLIGKIDKDGQVYNSNNVKVGQVDKKQKVAALLLLLKENNLFNQY